MEIVNNEKSRLKDGSWEEIFSPNLIVNDNSDNKA